MSRVREDLNPFWELLASIDHVQAGWETNSACQGVDTGLFYPERGESVEEANQVCDSCVVQAECLTVGLHEKMGIWGGSSERQRRLIRRQLAQQQQRGSGAAA